MNPAVHNSDSDSIRVYFVLDLTLNEVLISI